MLPLPDMEGRVGCLSCGRTMKVAPPAGPLSDRRDSGSSVGTFFDPTARPSGRAPKRPMGRAATTTRFRRMIGRALVVAFVLALVSTLLRDGSDEQSSPSVPDLSLAAGSTMLLPSDGPTTGLLAVVFDNESRRHVVARYSYASQNMGGGDLIWRSEPLPRDGRDVSYAVDGDDLYVATRSSVWKLDLVTGERRWEGQLPDLVPHGCADCFSVIDGQVVAQTIDGQVVALAATTGEEVWHRRFEDPGGAVTVAHDHLLVVDKSGEADAATVYWLDPATGSERSGQVLRCTFADSPLDPVAGVSTEVFAVPESDDVVAFFGFGCIMRWGVETNEVEWQRPWELGPQSFGTRPVLSPSHMVVADIGGNAVALDLDDGDVRALEPVPDQVVIPWRIDGTTVVAGTETERGTTRAGLAGWDVETGKRSWVQTSNEASSLVDVTLSSTTLSSGGTQWILAESDAARSADEPTVVAVDQGMQKVTIRTIDPATGETVSSADVSYRFGGVPNTSGSLSVEDQQDDILVLDLENLLQVIDLRSGELLGWRGWRPN